MVIGGDELNGDVVGEEEFLDSARFLVVEDELGEGVPDVSEKIENEGEGGDVCIGGFILLRCQFDIAFVDCDQNVVVSLAGLYGQTT